MRQEIDGLLYQNTQQVVREEPNKSTITTQQERYDNMYDDNVDVVQVD